MRLASTDSPKFYYRLFYEIPLFRVIPVISAYHEFNK